MGAVGLRVVLGAKETRGVSLVGRSDVAEGITAA